MNNLIRQSIAEDMIYGLIRNHPEIVLQKLNGIHYRLTINNEVLFPFANIIDCGFLINGYLIGKAFK